VNRRSRTLGFGSAAALVVAGILCAFIFSGGLGQNLAFALVALGLVLGTSLVFYEVGLTEDRQRASEKRERESERERAEPEIAERERTPKPGHPPERSARIRLDRMRGRPRRLR
jgi:hypothetical protein